MQIKIWFQNRRAKDRKIELKNKKTREAASGDVAVDESRNQRGQANLAQQLSPSLHQQHQQLLQSHQVQPYAGHHHPNYELLQRQEFQQQLHQGAQNSANNRPHYNPSLNDHHMNNLHYIDQHHQQLLEHYSAAAASHHHPYNYNYPHSYPPYMPGQNAHSLFHPGAPAPWFEHPSAPDVRLQQPGLPSYNHNNLGGGGGAAAAGVPIPGPSGSDLSGSMHQLVNQFGHQSISGSNHTDRAQHLGPTNGQRAYHMNGMNESRDDSDPEQQERQRRIVPKKENGKYEDVKREDLE